MNSFTKILILVVALFALAQADTPDGCTHARIHGATYGNRDITSQLSHKYNLGSRNFIASEQTLGSQDVEQPTVTVVYERCGNVAIETALDGEEFTLP